MTKDFKPCERQIWLHTPQGLGESCTPDLVEQFAEAIRGRRTWDEATLKKQLFGDFDSQGSYIGTTGTTGIETEPFTLEKLKAMQQVLDECQNEKPLFDDVQRMWRQVQFENVPRESEPEQDAESPYPDGHEDPLDVIRDMCR